MKWFQGFLVGASVAILARRLNTALLEILTDYAKAQELRIHLKAMGQESPPSRGPGEGAADMFERFKSAMKREQSRSN
jgi:hypothetical protein